MKQIIKDICSFCGGSETEVESDIELREERCFFMAKNRTYTHYWICCESCFLKVFTKQLGEPKLFSCDDGKFW